MGEPVRQSIRGVVMSYIYITIRIDAPTPSHPLPNEEEAAEAAKELEELLAEEDDGRCRAKVVSVITSEGKKVYGG